jgi:hypothetical protein
VRIGRVLSAILAPGYSWCQKCGTAWKFVEGRTVDYHEVTVEFPNGQTITHNQKGHFALCEECWNECDEDERVRYHMQSVQEWWGDTARDEKEVSEIIAAVRRDSEGGNG